MQKQIKQIKEFQKAFGLGLQDKPGFIDGPTTLLRNTLITEEVKELFDAGVEGDLIEVADAIGDILYVLLGTACEYGVIDKLPEIFDRIHQNNMGKIWPDGKVHRREDGKVLKPVGFVKVDLTDIIGEKWKQVA